MESLSQYFSGRGRYIRDRSVGLNLFFSLTLNFALWIGILLQYRTAQAVVPLHYTIYFGVDRLGPWSDRLFLPAFGLLVILINAAVGYRVYSRQRMLGYILLWGCTGIQLILLVAGIFIGTLT